MNPLCDFCEHQRKAPRGGVECGQASYFSHPDGYGPFKYGAKCIYDADLKPIFKPRTESSTNIQNMASTIDRQNEELMRARDRISKLESRLLDV